MSTVYEPFTIAELWHNYQTQLKLSGEATPYIHIGDMILINTKEDLADSDTEADIVNYAGCLFTVVQYYKVDDELWQWTVNDGEKDLIVYDSDIAKVFKPIK